MKTNNPFKKISGNIPNPASGADHEQEAASWTNLTGTAEWLNEVSQKITVPAEFEASLHEDLGQKWATRYGEASKRRFLPRRTGWIVISAVFLTLLWVFGLPLLFQNIEPVKPTAAAPAVAVATTPTSNVASTDVQAPLQHLLLSFFGSNVQAQSGGGLAQPNLTLNTALPQAPNEIPVYAQRDSGPIDADQARVLAARLGIEGNVFTSSSETGGKIYYVTDGMQEVWFIDSAAHFTYLTDFGSGASSSFSNQPLAVRAKVAEVFLKQRHLLDFDYQVDEKLSQGNLVVFTRVLSGQPLLETDAYNPHIEVILDGTGQVNSVYYNMNELDLVGSYPLRSAQAAWNIVLANLNDQRVQYTINTPAMSVRHMLPAWNRGYPIGQVVDLYSYPDVLQSAQAGGQPWVSMDGFTLQGDLSGLIDAVGHPQDLSPEQKARIASGEVSEKEAMDWASFFHVWGETSKNSQGVRTLLVEGWERSPMPDETLYGTFHIVAGQKEFITQKGQSWSIADIPADVPLNTLVSVRGIRDEHQQGVFIWSFIQIEPIETPVPASGGSGGGGGGGPLIFSPDTNVTPEPTATPLPMPYQVGQQIDGLVGNFDMVRMVESDGSKKIVAHLSAPLPNDAADLRVYQLLGDDLGNMASLYRLPVKVWGTYTQTADGSPAIQLQRYEEVYPGEKIQAWLGHGKVVELGGRHVLEFTDVSGKQYVLSHSITMPEESVEDPFKGQQCIIEGVLTQDSYAGLPEINDYAGRIAVGVSDLNGYVLESGQVPEFPDTSISVATPVNEDISIDQVELVYFAYDFSHGGGTNLNDSQLRFVQPVWKFSGTLSDGRLIDILVQAVTDAYLH